MLCYAVKSIEFSKRIALFFLASKRLQQQLTSTSPRKDGFDIADNVDGPSWTFEKVKSRLMTKKF